MPRFKRITLVAVLAMGFGIVAHAQDTSAMRTIKVEKDAVDRGKVAFAPCVACHGEDAAGKPGLGPALASESFMAAASDEYIIKTISEGRMGTTMVPWKTTLSSQQINDIVAFLRDIQGAKPIALDESPVKGDVANGKALYVSICASCHGKTGAGYIETQNGTAITNASFLAVASDGFLRHLIRYGKVSTAMRGFGIKDPLAIANLTDQEIDDVISYLRSQSK